MTRKKSPQKSTEEKGKLRPASTPGKRAAGGRAMHAGSNYQNRVTAWFATRILAETDATPPLSLEPTTTLEAIRCGKLGPGKLGPEIGASHTRVGASVDEWGDGAGKGFWEFCVFCTGARR